MKQEKINDVFTKLNQLSEELADARRKMEDVDTWTFSHDLNAIAGDVEDARSSAVDAKEEADQAKNDADTAAESADNAVGSAEEANRKIVDLTQKIDKLDEQLGDMYKTVEDAIQRLFLLRDDVIGIINEQESEEEYNNQVKNAIRKFLDAALFEYHLQVTDIPPAPETITETVAPPEQNDGVV